MAFDPDGGRQRELLALGQVREEHQRRVARASAEAAVVPTAASRRVT